MAIVKAPALSLEASGNLGGINYTRWRGSAIARAASSAVQPNTSLQQAVQANITTLSQAWASLTMAQRLEWRMVAEKTTLKNRLGDPYRPTAYNLYMSRNMIRLQNGLTAISVPDESLSGFQATGFIATEPDSVTVTINLEGIGSATMSPTTQTWVAGPFGSGGRQAQANEYRFSEANVAFSFVVGGFSTGFYYWIRVRQCQVGGRAGLWLEKQILKTI